MAIPKMKRRYERCKGIVCEGCGTKKAAAKGLCVGCYTKSRDWLSRPEEIAPRLRYANEPLVARSCPVCGEHFRPQRSDRTTVCSRKCGWVWQAHKKKLTRSGGRVSVLVLRARCRECDKPFTKEGRSLCCSDACRAERQGRLTREWAAAQRAILSDYVPRVFNCGECGVEVTTEYGNKASRYCSAECAKKNDRRRKRKKERALRYVLKASSLDPMRVFERDGWRCQLCGRKTPRGKRGAYASNAPELDHIVPLSRGGSHTYANVQCSCRACNAAKSNGPGGQLLLFGDHAA